ncbi:phytanoyl-CoA dioxygenase family protein [Streptomyces triticiradicis]|uniref:Phytanoyl-CoA dioxygenase family protein n=2 Tax=Streptomyces triticiradicis TaxID=2651189 RepID=A0A7J5D6A7_9ACTN|nr:phytanoyl-CoA dioxygenase family protein [Streptomyces triticiradicis]
MIIGDLISGRVSMSALTVDRESGDIVQEVIKRVKEFGVALVPGWLAGDDLSALQGEFEGAFAAAKGTELEPLTSEGKDISHHYGQTRTGLHLKYNHGDELRNALPRTHEVFTQDWMASVASSYLGLPCTLNRHLILTDDFTPDEEITWYHFDEVGALKFLVYLDDVDRDNGPFQAIPGTTSTTSRLRESEWLKFDDFQKIRIDVFSQYSEELFHTLYGQYKSFLLSRALTFQAPAGSLLVFDTDTIHRAGPLAEGRRRRVVRGSSYRGYWP